MTKINPKNLLLATLVLSVFPVFGYAKEDFNPSSFYFYLYFDHGQLFANRDFVVPYDVTTEEYKEKEAGENVYRGEIFSHRNDLLATFKFDPQDGKNTFQKGAITVSAPYFYHAKEARFYSFSGDQLLTIDLLAQALCNENRICNDNEDSQTCPQDCRNISVTPFETPPPFPEEPFWKNVYLQAGVGGGLVILVVALALKKLRKKDALPP